MNITVHVLLAGKVLCGSLQGTPNFWPQGNLWCRTEDWGEALDRRNKWSNSRYVRCNKCNEAYERQRNAD